MKLFVLLAAKSCSFLGRTLSPGIAISCLLELLEGNSDYPEHCLGMMVK